MAKKITAVKKSAPAKKTENAGLAAIRKKRRARARANPSGGTANPPAASDLMNVVLPGFGAYAATRAVARMAYALTAKRWPKLAKHVHAAAGLATAGGLWLLGHRWDRIAKYHDGIIMGSSVAALQGVAGAYLPKKYRWILSDPQATEYRPLPAAMPVQPLPAAAEDDLGLGDSFLERQLRALEGRGGTIAPPRPSANPVQQDLDIAAATGGAGAELDPELQDLLGDGEDLSDLYTGAFTPN